jgi:translation elongation factor EF-Tu-like GTPase
MVRVVVYIGKQKVIDEKRNHELSQIEIREIRNRYETHNTWISFRDKITYPNRLDYLEYKFAQVKK